MTNEKRNHAIEWITRELGFLRRAPALNGCEMKKEWAEQIEVFEAALEALNDHVREDTKMMDHFPDAAKMVPLTLEQLRGMDGQAAKVVVDGVEPLEMLVLIEHVKTAGAVILRNSIGGLSEYDSDDELQEDGIKVYAYQPAHIDQKACMMCKSPSALNRFLEMSCRYCPKCGRPLTPEALAELKHRMGVCT